MQHRVTGVVLAATAILALPAVADAATRTVQMGTPPSAQKALQKQGADVNQFFPSTLTIHVGDKVKFSPAGFHTVDIPPTGGTPLGLLVPDGKKVAGALDAAGAPFWFNGLDELNFNPAIAAVNGFGKSFTVPSAKRVESGLPFAARPKPVTVKFTKAGSYKYFCDVHPGMTATVKVVSSHKVAPTEKAVGLAVSRQVAAAKKAIPALQKTTAPANTVSLGAEKNGVILYAFFPSKLSVPVGSTVTFKMPTGSREVHTATFGPGDPNNDKAKSYLGDLAASLDSPAINPAVLYPSDPPPAAPSFSAASHGNGFVNTGGLDQDAASPPPAQSAIKFDQAGTFDYYCLIHPFMHGQIVVG